MEIDKNFYFGNHTDIGKVRKQNEDYMGYFANENGDLFVVCDGMGGHAGGSTASQIAVSAVRTFFESQYYSDPFEAIHRALQQANQQIYHKSLVNIELRGMGTTCVLLMLRDNKLYYGHVGDSRIYLHRYNRLERLTKDHSFVQALIDQGIIKEEEAETHPRRNELLRALGTGGFVDVAVCSEPIIPKREDIFLLCSDGLTSLVSDAGIEEILNRDLDIQMKAMKLVETANTLGGFDNITVQLIEFFEDVPEVYTNLNNSFTASNDTYSSNLSHTKPDNYTKTKPSKFNQYENIEPVSESYYSKNKFDDNIQITNTSLFGKDFKLFGGNANYQGLLFRGFLFLIGFVALYFIYQNTLGTLQVFGSSGTIREDSLRAIQIEDAFYAYFWQKNPDLKKVKDTYDKTRENIDKINEAIDRVDNLFKRTKVILNPLLENKTIREVARKHGSKIDWILKANGVAKEEDLKKLDSLIIPLEAPQIETSKDVSKD